MTRSEESRRLEEARAQSADWKRWGPYLSERAWGTVREDYSPFGTAWSYFPHDHARSRAYRWNEDGLGGICDRHQVICFAVALWNERDPILKERMFGLSGEEGNHGEDVKEYFFYLDSTPTHSYMRYLYKYPQRAYPYEQLLEENRRRGRADPEFELLDTGIFDDQRYFDVFVEYAKAAPEDIFIRITVENRGPDAAPLHVLPTAWFRNTWSWSGTGVHPAMVALGRPPAGASVVQMSCTEYGNRWLYADGAPPLLFTENDTNTERLYGVPRDGAFFKDGFNDRVVNGRLDAVNPAEEGTKAAAHYRVTVPAGGRVELRLRLSDRMPGELTPSGAFEEFEATFAGRIHDAGEFYATVIPRELSADAKSVMRQALGGLLWSKQVLPLRRPAVAGRRPGPAAAARVEAGGAEPRVDAAVQRRRALDAGQVGVSVVRGVGPRVPLRGAGPGGRRVREAAADAAPARVVHAPERPAAGV